MLLISITLGSFGQICLKYGLSGDKLGGSSCSLAATFLCILTAMLHPYVLLGLTLYVLSTVTWLMLLSKVRLSVAYPMISISYLLVVALSAVLLHERINWLFAGGGLLLISGGVSFIGLGLGNMRSEHNG